MIRYCIATAAPVKATQNANGEWSAEGVGAQAYEGPMRLIQSYCQPFNVTFYLTPEAGECLERVKNNLSDATSVLMPIDSISPYYFVPQPIFAGKLQYITGYNITDGKQDLKDTATVFSNAYLLKPGVYWCALFLVASFVALIVARIAMFYQMTNLFFKISPLRIVKRQLSRMFHHNSKRFKWITLLYSLLCFIMITSFLCLYKTSHIIMATPFYAKSYQESLDHPSSLAFYFNQFAAVSSAFENAPPDSIRGKLWAKLVTAGRKDDYNGAIVNPSTLPAVLMKASEEMTVRRGICLASPLIMPLIKSLACGFSPEGELWIIKILTDSIEPEVIYGHAMRKSFSVPPFLKRKTRALFETNIIAHTYETNLDQREFSASMIGASMNHQWRQKVVCEDETAFSLKPVVKAISLSYFTSFFGAVATVWCVAFIVHIFQMMYAKRMTKKTARGRAL